MHGIIGPTVTFVLAVFSASASHRGSGEFVWLVYLAFMGIILAPVLAIYRRLIVQRVRAFGGRNWPTMTATIDDFAIDEEMISGRGRPVSIYEVTLQYVFHSPEIQIGEYRRKFDDKDEAEAWANSFKGCTVTVHVNPRDPAQSVLREEELNAAAFRESGQKLTDSHSPQVES